MSTFNSRVGVVNQCQLEKAAERDERGARIGEIL